MEPFGQVENSLARSFEGTGLGLPLARRMTELHGGRLTVRSVKGVGTTVEVYLPASRILMVRAACEAAQAASVASGDAGEWRVARCTGSRHNSVTRRPRTAAVSNDRRQ